MDAYWRHNEAIKMYICELSKGLEKLKFDKTTSMLQNIEVHGKRGLLKLCKHFGSC